MRAKDPTQKKTQTGKQQAELQARQDSSSRAAAAGKAGQDLQLSIPLSPVLLRSRYIQYYGALLCPHAVFQKEESEYAQFNMEDTWYVRVFAVTAGKTPVSVVTESGQTVTLLTKNDIRDSRAVPTTPQVLTLKVRLLQVSHAVHRRLLSAAR